MLMSCLKVWPIFLKNDFQPLDNAELSPLIMLPVSRCFTNKEGNEKSWKIIISMLREYGEEGESTDKKEHISFADVSDNLTSCFTLACV